MCMTNCLGMILYLRDSQLFSVGKFSFPLAVKSDFWHSCTFSLLVLPKVKTEKIFFAPRAC